MLLNLAAGAKPLKRLTDTELERAIGHSFSIDENLFLEDQEAARATGGANWDPAPFAYGLCLGDGYINKHGAITSPGGRRGVSSGSS